MIVSISQPAYMPWLGYFDRIQQSDCHIILDDVMLERSSKTRFTNRNRIKTAQGSSWLSVPVLKSGFGQPLINEAMIEIESRWSNKHFRTLVGNYSKSAYLNDHISWFEDCYQQTWKLISPLLEYSTDYLLKVLGISIPMLKSSEMKAEGQKSDYILNLCKEAEATIYLSGPYGRDYLELDKFESAGIEVRFHEYNHPRYTQLYGEFLPYMSIVDLLFNEGPRSLDILTGKMLA
jgi:hypothetical protein